MPSLSKAKPISRRRVLLLAVLLVLSAGVSTYAWRASPDSPAKGYSWAKVYLNEHSPFSSVYWAHIELTDDFGQQGLFDHEDPWNPDLFDLSVYRWRWGVFVPWCQTRELWLRDRMSAVRPIGRDLPPPSGDSLLQAKRVDYLEVAQSDANAERRDYFSKLIQAVDDRLAGKLPERRVLLKPLVLDAAYLVAHLSSVLCFALLAPTIVRVVLVRVRTHKSGCPTCGYDITGLSTCPECGTAIAESASP